jgi:sacsin
VTDPGHLIDPGLQGFQGPALLARNNAVFTESDIRSLCSVGVSGKRDDILVAGKFGRGFNSVG